MLSSSLTFDTISFYYDFLIVAYCLICHHLTLRHYNNRKVQTTNFFRHYFHNANDIFFISFGKAFCAAEMHMKHSHKLYPSFSPLVDFLIQEACIRCITARMFTQYSFIQADICNHVISSA